MTLYYYTKLKINLYNIVLTVKFHIIIHYLCIIMIAIKDNNKKNYIWQN